jgi:hypothetical protein
VADATNDTANGLHEAATYDIFLAWDAILAEAKGERVKQ